MSKTVDLQMQKVEVCLQGLSDIMFDRFYDHSKNERPPEAKMYYDPDRSDNAVVMPAENIWSFLFAELNQGCARKFEGKKGKEYLAFGQSHIAITPEYIPFSVDKKPIIFKEFGDKFRIFQQSAPTKLSGGGMIKQEAKKRAILKMPWELEFTLTIFKNDRVDADKMFEWFQKGGILIGFGTYRPRFGRFSIKKWE